jgi:bisphosphoglycerate-dependent phosphoglycerate mutase
VLREGGYTFDVAYTSVLKRAIQTLGEKFGEAQVKSGGGVTISARRS